MKELLPKFSDSYLYTFDLEGCEDVGDSWLQSLRRVDNLHALNLSSCPQVGALCASLPPSEQQMMED